jgi:hypothetical protein
VELRRTLRVEIREGREEELTLHSLCTAGMKLQGAQQCPEGKTHRDAHLEGLGMECRTPDFNHHNLLTIQDSDAETIESVL